MMGLPFGAGFAMLAMQRIMDVPLRRAEPEPEPEPAPEPATPATRQLRRQAERKAKGKAKR